MSEESRDTLPNFQTVLEAITGLRQEMNGRLTDIEQRLTNVEIDVRETKELQFSFDIRLHRLEAMTCQSLSVSYNLTADMKILRREVSTRSQNFRELERRAA